jgi:hypothetical protein
MAGSNIICDAIRKRALLEFHYHGHLLDETFAPDDPNYNPNDRAMKQIYCRV